VSRSREFYAQLLAPLGIAPTMDLGEVVGFFADPHTGSFWLGPARSPETRELHLAFRAESRAKVDEVHRAAAAIGAEVLHPPRVWPEYHPDYYGVFLRDPDGHNVEAVCHKPEG